MNYEYLAIGAAGLSLILLAATVFLTLRVNKLSKLRREFFTNGESATIDDTIVKHNQDLNQLHENLGELGEFVRSLANANRKNYQKIGFIRYNPYGDTGGNISFVMAMLDADDNGVVISSMHGREGSRVYAKEVVKKSSKSPLTEEEQAAINEAK